MNETGNKTKSTAQDTLKLNLEDIAIGFRKFGWICVILALVFGLAMFVYKHINYVPKYTAEATFTVSMQNTSSIGGVSVYSSYYDSATANQLAKTFPNILESNLLYDAICEDLGTPYVASTLSASNVTGSNMFTMSSVSIHRLLNTPLVMLNSK